MTLYHGTGNDFDQFLQRFARTVNDYYGGGLAYFTTSIEIAKGYARAGMKRITGQGDTPTIFKVKTNFKKIFDVDDRFAGAELQKFVPKDVDAFIRASGIVKLGSGISPELAKVRLRNGTLNLSGDQIFKALEKVLGGSSKVRDFLITLGYDALRYNGGTATKIGIEHDVYIAYDAKSLNIQSKEPLKESADFQHFLVSN